MDFLARASDAVVLLLTALAGGLLGTLLANQQARALNQKTLEHQRLLERLSLYGRWLDLYSRSTRLIFSQVSSDRVQATASADSLSALTRHLRLLEPHSQNSRTITAGMTLVSQLLNPGETPLDPQELHRLHQGQVRAFEGQLRELEGRLTAEAGTRRLEHLSNDELRAMHKASR